jgi:hypothetical protein
VTALPKCARLLKRQRARRPLASSSNWRMTSIGWPIRRSSLAEESETRVQTAPAARLTKSPPQGRGRSCNARVTRWVSILWATIEKSIRSTKQREPVHGASVRQATFLPLCELRSCRSPNTSSAPSKSAKASQRATPTFWLRMRNISCKNFGPIRSSIQPLPIETDSFLIHTLRPNFTCALAKQRRSPRPPS